MNNVHKVKIISDSTCDLSPELIKRYDVEILPLYVTLGDESLKDGVDITPTSFTPGRTNIKPLQRLRPLLRRTRIMS